jgi:hypothetical protein
MTCPSCFKNLKELVVFMKKLIKPVDLWPIFFQFKKTIVVINQNLVFNFLELWL